MGGPKPQLNEESCSSSDQQKHQELNTGGEEDLEPPPASRGSLMAASFPADQLLRIDATKAKENHRPTPDRPDSSTPSYFTPLEHHYRRRGDSHTPGGIDCLQEIYYPTEGYLLTKLARYVNGRWNQYLIS
ncbi:hypothetical protein MLD38_010582 [Melastoma candidum]|uniref:Uncharacterized protein n=1 Tax=Melastoma candidum TaxID=119954 RepID=A0ACB9R0C3_9MYRT|nr:hypothetical protein MLD38_010582 [Melastoma candidum]